MKKIMVLILMCCVIFVACTSNDEDSEYITPAEQAEIWGEQTIEAFVNKDKDTLKGLFNEKMQKKYDLDVEIQKLFDYIDGEIVSYGEIFGDAGGGVIRGEEGKVQEGIICKVEDIKTDNGNTYTVYMSGYRIYKDDEEYLGIDGISIRNEDLFNKDSENKGAELTLSYD